MTPDFDLFHQVLFLVRRYLERLPGNFVIPFPFIPELLKALIVQGRVCFEGRQQNKTSWTLLSISRGEGIISVRNLGLTAQGRILPWTNLPLMGWDTARHLLPALGTAVTSPGLNSCISSQAKLSQQRHKSKPSMKELKVWKIQVEPLLSSDFFFFLLKVTGS